MARIEANLGLCQGYANCVIEADDVFDVDDEGTVVLLSTEVPEADRERVEAAARTCPVNALTVV